MKYYFIAILSRRKTDKTVSSVKVLVGIPQYLCVGVFFINYVYNLIT